MTLQEILNLEDTDKKITYLKKRKTTPPDTARNRDDWDVERHEIMWDYEKYPKRKVTTKSGRTYTSPNTGKEVTDPDETEEKDNNRIAIPLEQDITNIHAAFTVGNEPKMTCDPATNEEVKLFMAVKTVFQKNKVKYQNKKIVRSWLSEQEVAEYWYAVSDDTFWVQFWSRMKSAFGGKSKPSRKLKSTLFSPFRGDNLYPFFNDSGDFVAFSREYKRKELDINLGEQEITCFQTITDTHVYQWERGSEGWMYIQEKSFKHGFTKLPVIYSYRDKPYCYKIRTTRIRIEKILSSYADCIDYHFFPILKLFGDVLNFSGKEKDRVVQLTGDNADATYLTWEQVPTTVELELKTHVNNAYDMTNTPRISFETLKGVGSIPSGKAFEFMFLGAHMAVENHAEVIGEFMQRRVNFIASALGDINPSEFAKASKTIDIDTEIVPYTLDNIDEMIDTAVKAVEGGVWSKKKAIMFVGNADRVDEELKEIEDDKKKAKEAENEE